ncbi:crosslink repair DNA glycosylase YcaQ family protein [Janibacter alkaliphilus]|uniref:Winged helix DNA-binding domain-containing protein n=1 Tax=Janibacter alkaliphilus TaxID=1069963 RepID=A0A852X1G3_9MICO|nr:winged helix DNA-binding domain-containing protein [Janibacter alkaliphilus]NYG36709.1 hypothetical protein [Janibacter alkaliphilus]
MTRWSLDDVARMRLLSQRLVSLEAAGAAGSGQADAGARPVDVVRHLTCTQGQDWPGSTTSVALRTSRRSLAEVHAAYDAGEIVRSWPMRGTLFVVAAEDLGWMLDLMGAATQQATARRRAELGLTDEHLGRAEALAGATIPAEGLTRAGLLAVWEEAELPVDSGRGYHLIFHLALSQILCLGPTWVTEGGSVEQRFVLSERWLPPQTPLAREEAVARWCARYLRSHGPVTDKEFLWWSKLLRRDIAPVLETATAELTSIKVGGARHWVDPLVLEAYGSRKRATSAPLLLPGFDEIVLGYGDRSAVMTDAQEREHVVPGKNGVFRPTVIRAGRALGTWQRAKGKRAASDPVVVTPFGGVLPGPVEKALPRLTAGLPR